MNERKPFVLPFFFGFPGDTSIPPSPVAVQMRNGSFYRETLVMSGAKDDRPQFVEMVTFARPGDTIVVWRLDRLGTQE